MSNTDFWLWTLFFALISFFIIRAFCYTRCYITPQERMLFIQQRLLPKKPIKLYTINSSYVNKIDFENV